jgi:UDP-N-acetylmuramoyl-L-alanyl-D-glutamate--2,6-diaminopimelate ligase
MKKLLIKIKNSIRNLVPEPLLLWYHGAIAYLGALYYAFPSRDMIVIGITGTKGKTTTAHLLHDVLSTTYKTGLITTASIIIGDKKRMNPWHMTMPGRALIQKILKEMKDEGVTHVIIETTSEGLKQNRHRGIFYDIAIFTNLSPEHLPSHNGDYALYRKTKEQLFEALHHGNKNVSSPYKTALYVNGDDVEAEHFLKYKGEEALSYGKESASDIVAKNVEQKGEMLTFSVDEEEYEVKALGTYFVYNVLPVLLVASNLHIEKEKVKKALRERVTVPGRMETVDMGQNFIALVDYAHEKLSMTRLAETVEELKKEGVVKKWIVLLGAEGGGRDKRKRKDMGEIVGQFADYVVISNTDPYEEDEMSIALEIAGFVSEAGKREEENYFIVIDRKEGIKKALSLAKDGDIVTITGNGSQQFYHRKGERVSHDDREVVRDLIKEMTEVEAKERQGL